MVLTDFVRAARLFGRNDVFPCYYFSLQRGFMNHRDRPDGNTPLLYACARGIDPGLITASIRAGAVVGATNNRGWKRPPLHRILQRPSSADERSGRPIGYEPLRAS